MSHTVIAAATGIGLALVLGATGCRSVDVPEAPDVSELVSDYTAPTAVLGADSAQEIEEEVVPESSVYVAVSSLSVLVDALVELERQLAEEADPEDLEGTEAAADPLADGVAEDGDGGGAGDPADDEDGLPALEGRGNGTFRLVVRCPGEGRRLGVPPEPGTDGGRIRLIATLDDLRIQPVVWGGFEDCVFSERIFDAEERILLSGEVRLYLGDGGIDLGALRVPDVLFDIDIDRFEIGGLDVGFDLDFRLKRTGAIETRFDVAAGGGGGHLLFVVDDAGAILGMRDAETNWICDFPNGVCIGGLGEELRF